MSILGDKMQQTAGENSLQVQGNTVNIGMSYADVKDLCTTLIMSELASYEQRANELARNRFDSIMDKLLEALAQIDDKYRMRFQEPAIQFAASETFKEYIRSGNDELSDDLIDLMIERIMVDEHTTKQALIDEARQILPKLSPTTIAVLAILSFSKIILIRKKADFIEKLKSLSPILKDLGKPERMEIAYLEQVRCGQMLSFVNSFGDFIDAMMKTYAPVFSHSITIDDFNKYAGEICTNVGDNTLFLSLITLFETKGTSMSMNISVISEDMFLAKKTELHNALNEMMNRLPKYTKEEVCNFFLGIDPNWQNAIDLFNRKDIRSFIVSPVGYYIGTRKLTKILGEEIPISLFYSD